MTVGELCLMIRGKDISKNYMRANVGEYPVYSSQTIQRGLIGMIKTYDYDGEYVTWTTDGIHAGTIFYREGKFSCTTHCGLLQIRETYQGSINIRFLAYILCVIAKKYVNSTAIQPMLTSNVMAKIKIPVPSLHHQQKLVATLDKFDRLVNDISEGLPAELSARRKQYEYYRDKLLTFREA